MNPAPAETNYRALIESAIIANHFSAIVEEMSAIVMRAAHTVFVKETLDYSAALVADNGEMFAYPRSCVPVLCGTPLKPGIEAFETWRPGDVLITNDPYSTSGMVMHLPDVFLLKPIFVDDRLLCFSWTFIHASDVGGGAPGSLATTTNDIFQEGVRIRPTKLYSEGVFNDAVWNIFADNCRIPERNLGDINALLSAMDRAELRMQRLARKYGFEAVRSAITRTLDLTEQQARRALSEIPAGSYRFVDYLDDDFVSDVPIRLELTLTSNGHGEIELDFTGSDPQVPASLNLPTGGQRRHPLLSFALINFVSTSRPELKLNAGILRCIALKLPERSVVNAAFPAACGNRFMTAMRIFDATLGALSQAIPGKIPAVGASQNGLTIIAAPPLSGLEQRIAIANPVQGGSGGVPGCDGVSGVDLAIAFLRNVPTEILEMESPILVRKFGLVADSEGAGTWRGGFAVEYVLEVTEPDVTVVMRGKERYRFEPWGAAGGLCGTRGRTALRSQDGSLRDLGKMLILRPEVGDILVQRGIGGGGLGDPFLRDPERVLKDVRDGFVSLARAAEIYGVAIMNDAIDEAGTERLRHARATADPRAIDFGPERRAWMEAYGAGAETIRDRLQSIDPRDRPRIRAAAFAALLAGQSVDDLSRLLELQANAAENRRLQSVTQTAAGRAPRSNA
ncbi:hydantoinase B/oxoprolinase family protein [Chelatococcus sp. GCM10030263]|uniref:hydantoinase B/oxoprolinase family protein n=1 Tax=Chelatococcus sp. GCM10030263 TaxID=3273387 RepID=UPI00360E852C